MIAFIIARLITDLNKRFQKDVMLPNRFLLERSQFHVNLTESIGRTIRSASISLFIRYKIRSNVGFYLMLIRFEVFFNLSELLFFVCLKHHQWSFVSIKMNVRFIYDESFKVIKILL